MSKSDSLKEQLPLH